MRRSVGLAFGACTLHLCWQSGGSFDCSALIFACEYHTKTFLPVIGAVLSTAHRVFHVFYSIMRILFPSVDNRGIVEFKRKFWPFQKTKTHENTVHC